MKRFLVAVAALVLLGLLSFVNQQVYRAASEEMRRQLASGIAFAKEGELEQANVAMERLKEEIEGYLFYYNITTNHSEIDLMRESLTQSLAALQEGDLLSYMTEAKLLDSQLLHIYETERITWQNVF